jgi:hypothetical protein
MQSKIDELKELRLICYEIIKRIDVIEQTCQEQQRAAILNLNKRLAKLGMGGSETAAERIKRLDALDFGLGEEDDE